MSHDTHVKSGETEYQPTFVFFIEIIVLKTEKTNENLQIPSKVDNGSGRVGEGRDQG